MPEFFIILAWKNYQNTRFFIIFARKINKIPEFVVIFCQKIPEFYIIIARKIFFPIFFLGGGLPRPVSYAYAYSRGTWLHAGILGRLKVGTVREELTNAVSNDIPDPRCLLFPKIGVRITQPPPKTTIENCGKTSARKGIVCMDWKAYRIFGNE